MCSLFTETCIFPLARKTLKTADLPEASNNPKLKKTNGSHYGSRLKTQPLDLRREPATSQTNNAEQAGAEKRQ
jgi:hypothetical protein